MNKYLLIISVVLFSACHHKELSKTPDATNTTTTPTPLPEAKPDSDIKDVQVLPNVDMQDVGAACKVDSISVSGDVLSVFVNYSGGCKAHSWELLSNGMFAKSLPPKVTVCLKHTNNGDMCRELKMQEVKFNISKLKYLASQTVVVELRESSARYTYKN